MSALLISISGRLCGLWYLPRHSLNTIQSSLQHHYSVLTKKKSVLISDSKSFINFRKLWLNTCFAYTLKEARHILSRDKQRDKEKLRKKLRRSERIT